MAEAQKILDDEPRDYVYTKADFERTQKTIYKYVGISLSDSKRNMVYSRLVRRLRALNLNSFNEYLSLIESKDSPERQEFINALTTNLTSFFRENHHFPILEQHLRECQQRLTNKSSEATNNYMGNRQSQNKIHLWCCASSTGEEPYTMAITAIKTFNTLTPPVHILATDVDTQVLQKAQKGIYTIDRIENLPQNIIKEFFYKGKGKNDGLVKVRDEVRNLITFRTVNLLHDAWSIRASFDAIFCRNVMIYFDKETQYKVLKKFVPLIDKQGLLFVGHSENLQHASDLFKLRANTVYTVTHK